MYIISEAVEKKIAADPHFFDGADTMNCGRAYVFDPATREWTYSASHNAANEIDVQELQKAAETLLADSLSYGLEVYIKYVSLDAISGETASAKTLNAAITNVCSVLNTVSSTAIDEINSNQIRQLKNQLYSYRVQDIARRLYNADELIIQLIEAEYLNNANALLDIDTRFTQGSNDNVSVFNDAVKELIQLYRDNQSHVGASAEEMVELIYTDVDTWFRDEGFELEPVYSSSTIWGVVCLTALKESINKTLSTITTGVNSAIDDMIKGNTVSLTSEEKEYLRSAGVSNWTIMTSQSSFTEMVSTLAKKVVSISDAVIEDSVSAGFDNRIKKLKSDDIKSGGTTIVYDLGTEVQLIWDGIFNSEFEVRLRKVLIAQIASNVADVLKQLGKGDGAFSFILTNAAKPVQELIKAVFDEDGMTEAESSKIKESVVFWQLDGVFQPISNDVLEKRYDASGSTVSNMDTLDGYYADVEQSIEKNEKSKAKELLDAVDIERTANIGKRIVLTFRAWVDAGNMNEKTSILTTEMYALYRDLSNPIAVNLENNLVGPDNVRDPQLTTVAYIKKMIRQIILQSEYDIVAMRKYYTLYKDQTGFTTYLINHGVLGNGTSLSQKWFQDVSERWNYQFGKMTELNISWKNGARQYRISN